MPLLTHSPLDLASWLKSLVPDCYKLVCRALGCSETSTTAQVEAEIASSLQAERANLSRSNTFRAAEEAAAMTDGNTSYSSAQC